MVRCELLLPGASEVPTGALGVGTDAAAAAAAAEAGTKDDWVGLHSAHAAFGARAFLRALRTRSSRRACAGGSATVPQARRGSACAACRRGGGFIRRAPDLLLQSLALELQHHLNTRTECTAAATRGSEDNGTERCGADPERIRWQRAQSGFGALSDWPGSRSDLVVLRQLRSVRHGEDGDAHQAAGLVDGALHLVRHGRSALVQNRKLGLGDDKSDRRTGRTKQSEGRRGKIERRDRDDAAGADEMRSCGPRAAESRSRLNAVWSALARAARRAPPSLSPACRRAH